MTAQANADASSSTSAPPSMRNLVPPEHRGMLDLDRSAFTQRIPVLAAVVPAGTVGVVRQHESMRGQLADIPKIKTIVPDTDPKRRRMLLRVAREEELSPATREFLASHGATFVPEEVVLGYDYWTASEILNAIIPLASEEDVPSGFTQTGHIAHLNLRDEWLPYKNIIGQVILDKLPSVRTVVNKLNSIHAEFRYFDMEVLAGERDFIATTSESGCTFTFDFSRVYWNSRLHTEHARLISQFEPGQVIADAMAGVGPFAIPAAKKGCYVLCNDLNPESVKWARENQRRNKVENRVRVSERDARDFIRRAPTEAWQQPFARSEVVTGKQREREERARKKAVAEAKKAAEEAATSGQPIPPAPALVEEPEAPRKPQTVSHFVMNLPDSALEFLDAYAGCFTPLLEEPGFDADKAEMPFVHVHCFTRELEPEGANRDICERATSTLGHPVTPTMDGYDLHPVRRVAPNKDMYCLSFRLPKEVAYKRV